MFKKIIIGFFFFTTTIVGYSQAVIEVKNLTGINRKDEVITIPWKDILASYPSVDTANFKAIDAISKEELTYQLEYKGTSQPQNLLVQITVPANGKKQVQLIKGKHKIFIAKTFCRFVPERKDDFAWENDKIAFRMYGKALEKTPNEMAYGRDVWVKRTDRLILNERYKRNEYHIDHGDGMDYYHVGLTLGAGDIAPYVNDSIWFPGNYSGWKILDNGPLRSTFQLMYDEWMVASEKVSVTKTISIDAGSQLNKIVANFLFKGNNSLPVVTGIIKRKKPGAELFDEVNGIMGYWEPTDSTNGTTGVACISGAPVQRMMMNEIHLLSLMNAEPNKPMVYYSGASWDRAGVITSAGKWFQYLKDFKQKLKSPLKITVNKK